MRHGSSPCRFATVRVPRTSTVSSHTHTHTSASPSRVPLGRSHAVSVHRACLIGRGLLALRMYAGWMDVCRGGVFVFSADAVAAAGVVCAGKYNSLYLYTRGSGGRGEGRNVGGISLGAAPVAADTGKHWRGKGLMLGKVSGYV